ncbi:hypothetical protein DQX05_14300 [Paenibacillus thiaminolyticus]|uniref:Uncharacterized protein n=1 Tax=Paenibacillus thiaminolyticus TaxID=49283 RepID=A0A3A3GFV7_PANTH|nr:hypothetical protein DQX05_14300 [Paenibacillus thiaminolyticus]
MLKYDFIVSQNEQDYYPRVASGVASIMMLLTYHKLVNGKRLQSWLMRFLNDLTSIKRKVNRRSQERRFRMDMVMKFG